MLCERKFRKGDPEYQYIRASLEFDTNFVRLTSVQFWTVVLEALRQLHGEVGKAIPVDVERYNEKTFEAVMKVPYSSTAKVWTALTVFGKWEKKPCAFRVHKVANTIADLGAEETWEWS